MKRVEPWFHWLHPLRLVTAWARDMQRGRLVKVVTCLSDRPV